MLQLLFKCEHHFSPVFIYFELTFSTGMFTAVPKLIWFSNTILCSSQANYLTTAHLSFSSGPQPWGGKCHPWVTGCQLFATSGKFFAIFYYCFIFVDKERSPEILIQLNLGLVTARKFNLFLHTHCPFDCDNIKCEISSQILHHVIPPGQFCHPETQALLRACFPSVLITFSFTQWDNEGW